MNDNNNDPIDLILRLGANKTYWIKWPLDELTQVPKRYADIGLSVGMFKFHRADASTMEEIRRQLLNE